MVVAAAAIMTAADIQEKFAWRILKELYQFTA